jgi:hypothetical protein
VLSPSRLLAARDRNGDDAMVHSIGSITTSAFSRFGMVEAAAWFSAARP